MLLLQEELMRQCKKLAADKASGKYKPNGGSNHNQYVQQNNQWGNGNGGRGGSNQGGFNQQQIQSFMSGTMNELQATNNQNQPGNPPFPPPGPYKGFLASIKYRSKVACLSTSKVDTAYIDNGATHNFFHDRTRFETYEKMDTTDVSIASAISCLVGYGIITLPIERELQVKDYHAPEFESNIVSPRLLSKTYDVTFYEFFKPYPLVSCFDQALMTLLRNTRSRIYYILCLLRNSQPPLRLSALLRFLRTMSIIGIARLDILTRIDSSYCQSYLMMGQSLIAQLSKNINAFHAWLLRQLRRR